MKNRKTVFLTGSTGLVGSYLLKILLQNDCKVYALARRKDNKDARARVIDVLKFWDKKTLPKKFTNLVVLEGDIAKENLGLSKKTIDLLKKEIKEIFHCAAVTEFNWPLEDIRKINVEGTRNVLDLAVQCYRKGNFKKVSHISTAYVCGDHKGTFRETDLDVGQRFNTTYEQSKFEAEKLIQQYRKKGLWIDIFRPPFIIGESKTGKTIAFRQGFYQLLHIWNLEIFDYFPGKEYFMDIVFVDDLCKAILNISFESSNSNKNYHPFGCKTAPFGTILDISSKFLGFKKPRLVTRHRFLKINPTPVQKMILNNNIFLFNSNVKLHSKLTNDFLKNFGFKFLNFNKMFLLRSLRYCLSTNFLKRERILY
ncbi:MAG: hypothetical protein AMJ78_00285 [Omnitrophica WOR_2 bacterium SM23_29]|nr:MAG: hypothetical protein AMJ78_00285 [Omnitrophica WOR_2 bacterium SM23_29]